MCGIVAFVGKSKKLKNLTKVLKQLEYRGYDSAGFSSLENGEIITEKSVGNIQNLEDKVSEATTTTCFISHTRWATHGKPNETNAHPHLSHSNIWSVVHNGIIENFKDLKDNLKTPPKSETDTSVIAQLLEESNAQDIFDFIEVCKKLTGSFALACINKNKQDTLFLAKNKSPLYVSKNKDGDIIVASDPICFSGFSDKYYSFEDGQFALVSNGEVFFYDQNINEIKKQTNLLSSDFESSNKGEYKHFMCKEIFEQKDALLKQVQTYKSTKVLEQFNKDFISGFNKIVLIGCGTAYHAGLIGAKYFSKITGIFSECFVASEFIYSDPIFADSKTLFVLVSQSGETADTLRACEIAKQFGSITIALTNVLYSSLAKKCDYVLPVCAGVEIAVASTKAYVCQLSALYVLASHLKNEIKKQNYNFFEDIEIVANQILNFDKTHMENLAKTIDYKKEIIFIGKNLDYVTALESSLKFKEVSYVSSASYPSGELKHGFLALVNNGTPIIAFAGNDDINSKTANAVHEAVSRGAMDIVVTNNKNLSANNVVFIDQPKALLFPIVSVAPMQYMAYLLSINKGINPDQPRNLAKSVTVE